MPLERVATDVVADDLVATYRAGVRRLEALLRDALERGIDPDRIGTGAQARGDATAAYRERQLRAARAILRELEHHAQAAPVVVRRAYASSLLAVDRSLGRAGGALAGRFGGVHQRAVEVLAGNLERTLTATAARAGDNLEAVFARAAALEGPLEPSSALGNFIGRRADDPWRRVALEELGRGTVILETRRQITAGLKRRLTDEGVTDALTGYVDRAGRRWSLDTYAEMVTRTTTREATSRATVNRLEDHGIDLVAISSHTHAADICTPYDGATFSRTGQDPRYPRLELLPPFHPNCRHVVTPAGAGFEDFERELGIAAEQITAVPPAGGTATRFEDVLDVEPGSAATLRAASDAIAQTHRLPDDLPRIPFGSDRRSLPSGSSGAYVRTRQGRALRINVEPGADPAVTVHELGHFLDHKAFGDRVRMASESSPVMRDLLDTAYATDTIAGLRTALETGRIRLPDGSTGVVTGRVRGLLEYLLRPREIFARTYEQVICRRAGIRSRRHVEAAGLEYWPDDELDRLEVALDRLLETRGLT